MKRGENRPKWWMFSGRVVGGRPCPGIIGSSMGCNASYECDAFVHDSRDKTAFTYTHAYVAVVTGSPEVRPIETAI